MNLNLKKVNDYFYDIYDNKDEIGFFMLESCEDAYPSLYSKNEEDLEFSASLTEIVFNTNKRGQGYFRKVMEIIEKLAIKKGYDKIVLYPESSELSYEELKTIYSKVGYTIYKENYMIKEIC